MAKKPTPIDAPYQTYQGTSRMPQGKVPNSNLLPGVLQTTVNQKYINALLDDLTSKGPLESFDGWIGSKSGTVNRSKDTYLFDNNRLDIGIKSKNNVVGDLTDIAAELSSTELIDFKDAKQLLSSQTYSYNPRIDSDKFTNFHNYHWLPFDLPEIFLDAGFNDDGSPAEVDIANDIVGLPYYITKTQANGKKLVLRNGMKLYFVQRDQGTWVNSNRYLTIPADSDNPIFYIVAGVGNAIRLLPYKLFANPLSPLAVITPVPWDKKPWDRTLWDTDVLISSGKQYVTIAMGSANYNVWSRTNRWIHEQTVFETARYLDMSLLDIIDNDTRGHRPIIEFDQNIALWNHGYIGKSPIAIIADNISSFYYYEGTVNPVINGYALADGDRILIVAGDLTIRNKIYRVSDVQTGVNFTEAIDSVPIEGESVLVLNGPNQGETYHFDGYNWVSSQQLRVRGQAPLFRLFDQYEVPIEDFDTSAFAGNKIFGYAPGTNYDRELNLSIAFDSNYSGSIEFNMGAIQFNKYASQAYKEITGDPSVLANIPTINYFRVWDVFNDRWDYRSVWTPLSETFTIKSNYTYTVKPDDINYGYVDLIGNNWIFNPTYNWNIASSRLTHSQIWYLEENFDNRPPATWNDLMMVCRTSDTVINNYTGNTLFVANQRGVVFVETNDVSVTLPKSLFEPKETYNSEDILPDDYVLLWKTTLNGKWQIANIIARVKDDIRRPDIYVNGIATIDWNVSYDDNNNPVGLSIENAKENDIIDVVVNGSMTNTSTADTTLSNLANNPYNSSFTLASYGQMFQHWISANKKSAIPLFLEDSYHYDTQYPRFPADGSNITFGDNDWDFGTANQTRSGNNMVMHDDAANRYFWTLRSGEQGSIYSLLKDARIAYNGFKLKLIQKIEHINNDQMVDDAPAVIDKALSEIFIGRDSTFRYALSHMAMWGAPDFEKIYYAENYSGTISFDIPGDVELGEVQTDHIYVYVKPQGSDNFSILTCTLDYVIEQDIKTVEIFDVQISAEYMIRVYKKNRMSFIAPTPSKLGITPWYQPGIVVDNTYPEGPVNFIQGHDGSLTPAWNDYRDELLLEYERRVASSIGVERGKRAELMMNKLWPKSSRSTWYQKHELTSYLEEEWLTWANANNIVLTPNIGQLNNYPYTFNYSAFFAADGNVYGSWRDLYKHVYGTDRPHTHPWEMLGFTCKPLWWDNAYSWLYPDQRAAFIKALSIGDRSDGQLTETNVRFSLSTFVLDRIPVDADGHLIDPITLGWYDSAEIEANIEKTANDWVYGELSPYELAWRRSSDFFYSAAQWLLLSGGPSYLEEVWEGPRRVPSPGDPDLNIDYVYGLVSKWGTAKQHRETDNDIVPGFGMLVNERAASLLGNNLIDVIAETRSIKSQLQWTPYNFLESNSLSFVADILLEQDKGTRLPEENYHINLKVTSPDIVLTYSGVKVIQDSSGGYRIDGYDDIATYFTYYPVNTTGMNHTKVQVGNISYVVYFFFEPTPKYLEYGSVLATRQEVVNFLLGYGKYLETLGWVFKDLAPTESELLDWQYSAREFATWSQTRWQENTQIALSPGSQHLVLNHDSRFFGRLDTTFLNKTYLLDNNSNLIEFKDTEIIRGTNDTVLKSRPGVGMYFVRCGLEQYTHVVTFDDVTTFNDIINDYHFGIRIPRLRAQGLRTTHWDGRPNANGYIVREDGLLSNFDTISREIGDDYISVENRSANPWIKDLKKAQQGQIIPDTALLNTGWDQDTIDQFESASFRRKGTPNLIDKFAKGLLGETSNPNDLPFDSSIAIKEDWMFRMGEDFGNVGEKTVWEIKLPPGSRETLLNQITIREIPEFKKGTRYQGNVDLKSDNIIDLLGPNDRRWIKHPTELSLPVRSNQLQDGDMPQAGVANQFETDYQFMDIDGLGTIDLTDIDTPMGKLGSIDRWDAEKDYEIGDQVRNKGKLFECTMSHLASTLFQPEYFKAISEPRLPSIWCANKTPESNDVRDWTIFQVMDGNLGIREICAGTAADPLNALVEMIPGTKHNLNKKDWVFIASTEKPELVGFYQVTKLRDTESFYVSLKSLSTSNSSLALPTGNTSADGKLFVVKEVHFYNPMDMNASITDPSYHWLDGMEAYIDDRVNNPKVFIYGGNYDFAALDSDRRGRVFYDFANETVLHDSGGSTQQFMPWLFPIGMLLATFKEIANGRLTMDDTCHVSLQALNAHPPKLPNFSNVSTITVRDALIGIIFRQYNDCTYILAEKIYGSITDAVASVNTMLIEDCLAPSAYIDATTKLGYGTVFDLSNIAKHIWETYPQYHALFATTSWFFRGMIYVSDNKLITTRHSNGIGFMALENMVNGPGHPRDEKEYHIIGIKQFGNKQLMITSTGYKSKDARDAEASVLLDTVNNFDNPFGNFRNVPFVLDRTLGDIVDQTKITKVEIVDCINNVLLATLNPYDPAAGVLPEYVDKYINWKSSYDPANYTNADEIDQVGYTVRPRYAWYDEHIGEIWWNLSTVRYFDYYQGTTRDRAFQWGKQFPGSSVEMYEWIQTTVPPQQWQSSSNLGLLVNLENVSGTPYHTLNENGEPQYLWSERVEKDKTGVLKTLYYFWVKNLDRTQAENRQNFSLLVQSTAGSSTVSYNVGTAGVTTSPAIITVSEIASTVGNPYVTGSRWFAGLQSNAILISGCSDLLQNPGAVIRIEINNTPDEHSQWLLLKENDTTSVVPDWLHIRLRDSIIGTDQNVTVYDFSPYAPNVKYTDGTVVTYKDKFYRAFRDFLPKDVAFADGSLVTFVNQPWQRLWDFTVTSATSLSEIQGKSVPDYNRHPYNRYGNEIRPTQQSWLNDRIEAIRVFVDAANIELARFPVTSIDGWDTRLNNIIKTVDETLVYDMRSYWNYADYVSTTYNPLKEVTTYYTTLSELYLDTVANVGDYVSVLVGEQQLLNVWEKLNNGWKIVFQQNGTIQINKKLFDIAKRQDLWDASPWDSLRWDGYPFVALSEIITALREDVFVYEHQVNYSIVFFALVREVLRQNAECHWIRKSTYIDVVKTSTSQYANDPYFRKEYLRNDDGVLIDYINQIKPYHTKVLNQIEVDQLLEKSNITVSDDAVQRTMKIIMKVDDVGDQKWSEYFIDGHPWNHLLEGWDRNPWDFEFTAVGKLPATGAYVERLKQYLWDMDQPRYYALLDTIINGYSFGVQPDALDAIINGNAFYQPQYDKWPQSMMPLSPGESIEIRVINNTDGSTEDANTVSWRYHLDILGGLKVYRYNNDAKTTLTRDLQQSDTELYVDDVTVFTRPDPVNGKPGVVWISQERIEFWYIDAVNNKLTGLVRSTLGTPMLDHPTGRAVFDCGQQNQVPSPEELTDWHDSLYPMWNDREQTLMDSSTVEALFLKEKPGFFGTDEI